MSGAIDSAASPRKLGILAYVLAGLSVLPVIGVAIGAIAITWGLNTRKAHGKRLATFAVLGVALSVGLSAALYREVGDYGLLRQLQRLDTFDLMRAGIARSALDRLVFAIEFYKVQHGRYPETLDELSASVPQDVQIIVIDPMTVRVGKVPANFFYRRVDSEHYYLRSVGPDGIPFTADDIVPGIEVTPGSKLGLLKKPPTQI
jgi:hypothetical protein